MRQQSAQESTSRFPGENLEPSLLDPEIALVLDGIEGSACRKSLVGFLTDLGLVSPRIASDQKIHVDRDGLLPYLLVQDANCLSRFCELVDNYAGSTPDAATPSIDVPSTESLNVYLHRRLDRYGLGEQWLRQAVPRKDQDGALLSDHEVRLSLLRFMREQKLSTVEDVVALAIKMHTAERAMPTSTHHAGETPLIELRPGELSCQTIMETFVTDDPSWSEDVEVREDEINLFYHCQAKFDREYAHVTYSLDKARQRRAVLNALVIIGRRNPDLVGYQFREGEVGEPRYYPCS